MALDTRFRGGAPALVTPRRDDGDADLPAMRRLVDHVVVGGADALNILGTTGEFSLVAPRLRRPIIRAAIEAAADRVPVMVGCGRPSVEETVGEIREAAECGAAAALVTPSYYFPLSEAEVVAFVRRVAEGSPLPLLYYHYPQMTDCAITAPAIGELARAGAIAGIKDSSGDAGFFARLAVETADLPDFRIFIGGSAFLLGALALGAHGVIGALGSFAQHLDQAVMRAFADGDIAAARCAQAAIVRANFVFFRANPAAAAKAVLAHLGICGEAMFPPFAPLDPDVKQAMIDALPSFAIGTAPPAEAALPA